MELEMSIDSFKQKYRDYTKDLLLQIETKYKDHKDYEEFLKWDISPAKEDLGNTYHLRRIGYHLCTEFKDNDMAEDIFDMAVIEASFDENGDVNDDMEDLIDVLNDMTFLDEDAAKEVARRFDLEI